MQAVARGAAVLMARRPLLTGTAGIAVAAGAAVSSGSVTDPLDSDVAHGARRFAVATRHFMPMYLGKGRS